MSLEAGDGGKTNVRFNATQYTVGDRKKDEKMKPFLEDVENLIEHCEKYGIFSAFRMSTKHRYEYGPGENNGHRRHKAFIVHVVTVISPKQEK